MILSEELKSVIKKTSGRNPSDVLIQKTLNGILLIDKQEQFVAKIINCIYEPNFLFNETTSSKFLPNNVPKVTKSGKIGDYFYIYSKYIAGQKAFDWSKWNFGLEKTLKLIRPLYLSYPIKQCKSEAFTRKIRKDLNSVLMGNKFLGSKMKEVVELLNVCFDRYDHDTLIYKTFQHGDLVPNNVLRHGTKLYIIDWANGGIQNIFYDLTMEEFYFTNHSVWENFNKIDFTKSIDKTYFYGVATKYIGLFEKKMNLLFTDKQIKLSIIISLAEVALKNFLRYQSSEEYKDGIGMLTNTSKILRQILKN